MVAKILRFMKGLLRKCKYQYIYLGCHEICIMTQLIFSFASGNFCHLLITFAKRLDPDQDRQEVECRSWSEDKSFNSLIVLLKELFE